MTRLFLRFYASVLLVLFLAWFIHGTVLRRWEDADWERVVTQAHRGGARLVAEALDGVDAEQRQARLEELQRMFKFPLTIVARDALPPRIQRRLAQSEPVVPIRETNAVVTLLADETHAVQLGPFPNHDLAEIEESLSGWMQLFARRCEAAAPSERAAVLEELRRPFAIDVRVVPRSTLPAWARRRLDEGAEIVFYSEHGEPSEPWYSAIPLSGSSDLVRFGPFPSFQHLEHNAATITLALVLFPAAAAIALLLRPIFRQLRHIEETASTIAAGDFSARVDQRKISSARTLAEAFNQMAERTETVLRMQRDLLQAVSHELRTPLARIGFAIDLLREAPDAESRELRLRSLENASHELDALVAELLRYVRLETIDPALPKEDVEPVPVIEELIEAQSVLHPSITFTWEDASQGDACVVHADRQGFQRALGNVLSNAGRFARHQVCIRMRPTAEGTEICVDDDGPGIPAGERQRVFEAFVRLDESSHGAGLGLALVQRILAHHGGWVRAEDNPLGGCRIRMMWPHPRHASPRSQRGRVLPHTA